MVSVTSNKLKTPNNLKTPNKVQTTPNKEPNKLKTPSQGAKQLFMKKYKRFFKTFKPKTPETTNANSKNIKIVPSYIQYYSGPVVDHSFKTKLYAKRHKTELVFRRDSLNTYFYKYVLKNNTNPTIMDMDWFGEVQKYIFKLTYRERFAVYGYTMNGDTYVNNMERGLPLDYDNIVLTPLFYEFIHYMADPVNARDGIFRNTVDKKVNNLLKVPAKDYRSFLKESTGHTLYSIYTTVNKKKLFTVDFTKLLIRNLANTLSGAIKKAPVTTKPMVVFRGVTDAFFLKGNSGVYRNKGFVSTSLQYTVPLFEFMNLNEKCCFKVITVLPGTRCLPMIGMTQFPSEMEILFDRDTKYIIRDTYRTSIPTGNKPSYINDVQVTDIIIG